MSMDNLPLKAQAAVNQMAYLAWKARGYSKFPSIRKSDEDWAAIANVADKGAMLAAGWAEDRAKLEEPCGKCRLEGLVLIEVNRLLQNLMGWAPDNDARREAMRFLRMGKRRVHAAILGGSR